MFQYWTLPRYPAVSKTFVPSPLVLTNQIEVDQLTQVARRMGSHIASGDSEWSATSALQLALAVEVFYVSIVTIMLKTSRTPLLAVDSAPGDLVSLASALWRGCREAHLMLATILAHTKMGQTGSPCQRGVWSKISPEKGFLLFVFLKHRKDSKASLRSCEHKEAKTVVRMSSSGLVLSHVQA